MHYISPAGFELWQLSSTWNFPFMQAQMSVSVTKQEQSAAFFHLKSDLLSSAVCVSGLFC